MKKTKEHIEESFLELLEIKPYNKITVKDISEKCGINRNTFYYYYRDISDILETHFKKVVDELIKGHEYSSFLECFEPLIVYCSKNSRRIMNLYSEEREKFLTILNRIAFYAAESFIEAVYKENCLAEEERNIMTLFCKACIVGIALDWLDNKMSYDILVYARKIHDSGTRLIPMPKASSPT